MSTLAKTGMSTQMSLAWLNFLKLWNSLNFSTKILGIFIVGAKRTPFGAFGGALKTFTATDLAVHSSKAAIAHANIDPAKIDETIFGKMVFSYTYAHKIFSHDDYMKATSSSRVSMVPICHAMWVWSLVCRYHRPVSTSTDFVARASKPLVYRQRSAQLLQRVNTCALPLTNDTGDYTRQVQSGAVRWDGKHVAGSHGNRVSKAALSSL